MTKMDFISDKQLNQHPANINPLIANTQADTLVNTANLLQFLQDCDLLAESEEQRFTDNAANGLHLVLDGAIQALWFEVKHRKKTEQ